MSVSNGCTEMAFHIFAFLLSCYKKVYGEARHMRPLHPCPCPCACPCPPLFLSLFLFSRLCMCLDFQALSLWGKGPREGVQEGKGNGRGKGRGSSPDVYAYPRCTGFCIHPFFTTTDA